MKHFFNFSYYYVRFVISLKENHLIQQSHGYGPQIYFKCNYQSKYIVA